MLLISFDIILHHRDSLTLLLQPRPLRLLNWVNVARLGVSLIPCTTTSSNMLFPSAQKPSNPSLVTSAGTRYKLLKARLDDSIWSRLSVTCKSRILMTPLLHNMHWQDLICWFYVRLHVSLTPPQFLPSSFRGYAVQLNTFIQDLAFPQIMNVS